MSGRELIAHFDLLRRNGLLQITNFYLPNYTPLGLPEGCTVADVERKIEQLAAAEK